MATTKKWRKPAPYPARTFASFAPGIDAKPGHGQHQECHGCINHPSPWCAACGAPTAYILPAHTAPSGELHALTLCRSCALVALEWSQEAARKKQVTADRARLRRRQTYTARKEAING
jgi:hypothetical protein